jgi:hypothetical protein
MDALNHGVRPYERHDAWSVVILGRVIYSFLVIFGSSDLACGTFRPEAAYRMDENGKSSSLVRCPCG